MAKEQRKKTDAARRAKLTIQRRSLCLMILLGVVTFAALFTQLYTLMIRQHEELQERASKQQTKSTTISASRGVRFSRIRRRSCRALSRSWMSSSMVSSLSLIHI